jgi:hypothetical protein
MGNKHAYFLKDGMEYRLTFDPEKGERSVEVLSSDLQQWSWSAWDGGHRVEVNFFRGAKQIKNPIKKLAKAAKVDENGQAVTYRYLNKAGHDCAYRVVIGGGYDAPAEYFGFTDKWVASQFETWGTLLLKDWEWDCVVRDEDGKAVDADVF